MIFYDSFYTAIKNLSDEDRLQIYDAIIGFAVEGKEPEKLNSIPQMIYTIAKPMMEANIERKKNGSLGGRPRKDGLPPNRNKFLNFTPSGTDWNKVADEVVKAQERNEGIK